MHKKLCISWTFSNLGAFKHYSYKYHVMHNLYASFVKFFEICRDFYKELINEWGRYLGALFPVFQILKL